MGPGRGGRHRVTRCLKRQERRIHSRRFAVLMIIWASCSNQRPEQIDTIWPLASAVVPARAVFGSHGVHGLRSHGRERAFGASERRLPVRGGPRRLSSVKVLLALLGDRSCHRPGPIRIQCVTQCPTASRDTGSNPSTAAQSKRLRLMCIAPIHTMRDVWRACKCASASIQHLGGLIWADSSCTHTLAALLTGRALAEAEDWLTLHCGERVHLPNHTGRVVTFITHAKRARCLQLGSTRTLATAGSKAETGSKALCAVNPTLNVSWAGLLSCPDSSNFKHTQIGGSTLRPSGCFAPIDAGKM